ncbi:MAG: hypothetical protein OEV42_09960 [Deltaproteobacteria bacterium]|nr:hypothetical protein [Deltaproteobacteria bacterium]
MRWLKISLRTLHLAGMAGMAGIFFSTPPNYHYYPFVILIYVTGFLFVAIELWSNGVWLIQLRGMAIYLKLVILSFLFALPGHEITMIIFLIIISGMISHAPADVRYYSIFHGRRI